MGACFERIPGGSSRRYREEDLGNGNGGATATPRSVGMGAPSAPAQPPATGASRPPTPPSAPSAPSATARLQPRPRHRTATPPSAPSAPSATARRQPPAPASCRPPAHSAGCPHAGGCGRCRSSPSGGVLSGERSRDEGDWPAKRC
jgi:hypothetical protein